MYIEPKTVHLNSAFLNEFEKLISNELSHIPERAKKTISKLSSDIDKLKRIGESYALVVKISQNGLEQDRDDCKPCARLVMHGAISVLVLDFGEIRFFFEQIESQYEYLHCLLI